MRAAAGDGFALLQAVVERAKAAGAVAEDVDAADVRELIFLFSRRPEDHGYERTLALAMRGWVQQAPALPGAPLPGRISSDGGSDVTNSGRAPYGAANRCRWSATGPGQAFLAALAHQTMRMGPKRSSSCGSHSRSKVSP
jgi:hypothetical protein